MRFLIIFLVLFAAAATPVYSMSDTTFDEFIKSREVVETFYFKPNAETLNQGEQKKLAETIGTLRKLQSNGRMIRVEGFSSPEGDQEKNFKLSFYRARTVADLIENGGGLPAEVALTGYGDLRANSDDFNKERRVEIVSYIKPVAMSRIKVAKKDSALEVSAAPNVIETDPSDQVIDPYRVDQAIRRKIDDKNRGIADQLKELEKEVAPGLSQSSPLDSKEDIERGYSLWRKSVDPDYAPKVTQFRDADSELKRGYSRQEKKVDPDSPKLGQVKDTIDSDLQRGYSQQEKEVTPDSPKLGQVKDTTDSDLQRGYSKQEKVVSPDSPKFGQVKAASDGDLQRSFTKWIESVDTARSQRVTLLSPRNVEANKEESPDVTMVLPEEMAPVIDALMIEQAIMEKIGADTSVPTGTITQVAQPDVGLPVQ